MVLSRVMVLSCVMVLVCEYSVSRWWTGSRQSSQGSKSCQLEVGAQSSLVYPPPCKKFQGLTLYVNSPKQKQKQQKIIISFIRYSITKVERDMFNPCNSSKGNALVKIVLIMIKYSAFLLGKISKKLTESQQFWSTVLVCFFTVFLNPSL